MQTFAYKELEGGEYEWARGSIKVSSFCGIDVIN